MAGSGVGCGGGVYEGGGGGAGAVMLEVDVEVGGAGCSGVVDSQAEMERAAITATVYLNFITVFS